MEHDAETRAVVVAANGKAFCAGHNLKEMVLGGDPKTQPSSNIAMDVIYAIRVQIAPQNQNNAYYRKLFGHCANLMTRIQSLPVPVIGENSLELTPYLAWF